MYSRGKAELEKEKEQKILKNYSPRDVITLAKTTNIAAKELEKTIENTYMSLTKLKSQADSIQAIGNITVEFKSFIQEIKTLKNNQQELTRLLKAVLTESYKDAETRAKLEGMLI